MKPYERAQIALANLKVAVYDLLIESSRDGMTNAEIGRSLGIYAGHVRHEGHISRTILAMLEHDGVAEQDQESKRWSLSARQLQEHSIVEHDASSTVGHRSKAETL